MTIPSIPEAKLIERYSTAGPRYTSYPTAAEFTECFGASEWTSELVGFFESSEPKKIALYVHVPFCAELCYYCACNKVIAKNTDVVEPYLAAIKKEVTLYQNLIGTVPSVVELHLGGGTPNFLAEKELASLYKILSTFNISSQADISIEVDPRTLRRTQLEVLSEHGFNRLSLGVQDFDPHVQQVVNRIQSIEQTSNTVEWGRALGFSSINIDLIYGLPEQTPEGFSRTLNEVIKILPDRISLFGYAHVTWISKTQRTFARAHVPTPAERLILFQLAIEKLSAAGYEHIGLDHFALPGDELCSSRTNGNLSRNFMGYTSKPSEALLAFGPSAISSLPTAFAQNDKALPAYYSRLANGDLPTVRGVCRSRDDQIRGDIIQALFCFGQVDLQTLSLKWQEDLIDKFSKELNALQGFVSDKLLSIESAKIEILPDGRFFLRNIAMVFDAHLARHQSGNVTGTKPVFSQTV
jgi:oxygen-independent coproporphyrinogen-3 oxidase